MDGLGEKLLSCASLAPDQNIGLRRAELLCDPYGLFQGGTSAANILKGMFGYKALPVRTGPNGPLLPQDLFHALEGNDASGPFFPPTDTQFSM